MLKSESQEHIKRQRMLNEFQNPEIFRRSRLRDDFTIPGNIYEQFGIVAKICLMKCQILKNIGDLPQCKMWMNLPQSIYQDIEFLVVVFFQSLKLNLQFPVL